MANQFRSKWLHSNSKPTPAYIYLIVGNGSHIASYNAYCNRVESQGNFASRGRPYGNQNRRFHGTTRDCLLGDYGVSASNVFWKKETHGSQNTQLCSSTNCALCSIIRNSFDLKFYKKKTSWGRFGRGYGLLSNEESSSASIEFIPLPLHPRVILTPKTTFLRCTRPCCSIWLWLARATSSVLMIRR